MSQIRKRLSYANVVSSICLFVLLGGGAYAAAKLPKNSVGPKQIRANAIHGKQLAANAVNGAKVADGSLTGADVADGSLTGADLANATVATAKIADKAINSAKVLDNSLKGSDIAPDTITGSKIDESTLGPVPTALNSKQLEGKSAAAFLSSSVYKKESALEAGTDLGDGTHAIEVSCNPGDLLLSGGPADVSATSTMVESFPAPGTLNGWKVRLATPNPDNFLVVLLCVDQ